MGDSPTPRIMSLTSPPTRVLLDVDTVIDDALALLYAANEPRLDLVGVSTVVGNVSSELGAENSRAVLASATATGRHVPVVPGAAVTTTGKGPRTGLTNHGADEVGGVTIVAPEVVREPPGDPLDFVRHLSAEQPLTVVACAPLTNVARYASLPGVEQVVLVGGELEVEGEPEFNVGHDPVAAAAVIGFGLPTTVYAIDVFESVAVPSSTVARLKGSRRPAARLAGELLDVRRANLLGDAGAVVALAHPELFTVRRRCMGVLGDRLVLVQDPGLGTGREVDVVVAADPPAVVEAFLSSVLG